MFGKQYGRRGSGTDERASCLEVAGEVTPLLSILLIRELSPSRCSLSSFNIRGNFLRQNIT